MRSPSCDCQATRRQLRRASSLAQLKVPHIPIPGSLPVLDIFPVTASPALTFGQTRQSRRFTSRLTPVFRIRCQVYLMRTEGLSHNRAVSRCLEHRDQAATGAKIVGSHIFLPPPPTRTTPTGTLATSTTPSSPRPFSRRQGTSLVDRPRYGAGVILRDDIVKALVNSRAVGLGYRLKDSAKPHWRKMQRSARVWYRRVKWFVRISIEEEDPRNGNLLGLLWLGCWLIADRHDEDAEADTEVADATDIPRPTPLAIEWHPADKRDTYSYPILYLDPRALVREDVLASLTLSTLWPSAVPAPVPPRLMIEWHPATRPDQSQSAPATPPRRPRRDVRPGHSVYQPPGMQTGLPEERHAVRYEARRQMLEKAEREAQEPVSAPRVEPQAGQERSERRGRRGGRKVRERRAATKERLANAAVEVVV